MYVNCFICLIRLVSFVMLLLFLCSGYFRACVVGSSRQTFSCYTCSCLNDFICVFVTPFIYLFCCSQVSCIIYSLFVVGSSRQTCFTYFHTCYCFTCLIFLDSLVIVFVLFMCSYYFRVMRRGLVQADLGFRFSVLSVYVLVGL